MGNECSAKREEHTWRPIDRCRDFVLIARDQAIHNPQHLCRIPAGTRWIAHDQADGLLRINDEDRANRKRNPLAVDVGCVLVVKHVV